MLCTYVKLQK
jgi:hypothetical protein